MTRNNSFFAATDFLAGLLKIGSVAFEIAKDKLLSEIDNKSLDKDQAQMKTVQDTKQSEVIDSSVRYHYIRNRHPSQLHKLADGTTSKGSPIACVASRVNHKEKCIEYGISTVHNKLDVFDYKQGRKIALGRLDQDPIEIDLTETPGSSLEILRLIMGSIVLDEGKPVIGSDGSPVVDDEGNIVVKGVPPTRVKREAEAWLEYKKSAVPHAKRAANVQAVVPSVSATVSSTGTVKKVPRYEVVVERR